MTYEEELEKVVLKLEEHRKRTSKDRFTRVTFTDTTFTKLRIQVVISILLQLQDDEKILKIVDAYQELGSFDPYDHPKPDNYDDVEIIIVELNENYDEWYDKYLMKQKSNIRNLDSKQLLRVYDMILDINDSITLKVSNRIQIPILPGMPRFSELCPNNFQGVKVDYYTHRWAVMKYLHKLGIVKDYQKVSGVTDEWDEVAMLVNIAEFEEAYQYLKSKHTTETTTKIITPIWNIKFRWDHEELVFDTYGRMDFDSDDRKHIMRLLVEKAGDWAMMDDLKGKNNDSFVRKAISELRERIPNLAKTHVEIISTKEKDDYPKPQPLKSAYRLRVTL